MSQITYIGIDVSKKTLQVALDKRNIVLPNSKVGIKKLTEDLRKLNEQDSKGSLRVILEATGGYEIEVMTQLQSRGIGVSRINGKAMRNFARATMKQAKTDKIDAEQIKLFGQRMTPELSRGLKANELALNKRVHRHQQLKELINMETARLEHDSDKQTTNSIKRVIKYLESEKDRNQRAMYELEKKNEELNDKTELLSKISGIGKLTALSILGLLPEIGEFKRGQVASLCGLAPHNRDSGTTVRGHRFTGGGRKTLRNILYMPAVCAARHDPVFSAYYTRLKNAGKKGKVALVAIMRRMIEKCNAIIKDYYRGQKEDVFPQKKLLSENVLQAS